MSDELSHTDENGRVQMVDVGAKPSTARRAVAAGTINLAEPTVAAIREDAVGKGAVIPTARTAAVQAVKHTWETIPLCHQIPITNVETTVDIEATAVHLEVAVETIGQTGCEMEALTGVTTGLATIWDMVKGVEKDEAGQYPTTRIGDVRVREKTKRSLD